MTLTSIDQIAIRDLLKQIESILGEYDESPYDQIDNLRAKLAEISDIAEDTSGYNISNESAREEAMKSEVYNPLKQIYDDFANSKYQL